jgi:hypothetical protein
MRQGKLHSRWGPLRWRASYLGPWLDAADPWRWQLVVGPFEIEYRSTLDRLVDHDLVHCRSVLNGDRSLEALARQS